MNPHEAIDRDFPGHLERIRDFLRIPSVSAADGDLRVFLVADEVRERRCAVRRAPAKARARTSRQA